MREYLTQAKPRKRADTDSDVGASPYFDGARGAAPPARFAGHRAEYLTGVCLSRRRGVRADAKRRRLASEDEFDSPYLGGTHKAARAEHAAPVKAEAAAVPAADDKRRRKGGGKHTGNKSIGRKTNPAAQGRTGVSAAPADAGDATAAGTPTGGAAAAGAGAGAAGQAGGAAAGGEPGETEDTEAPGRVRIGSISFDTFLKFIEPYFRPLTEGDVTLLDVSDVRPPGAPDREWPGVGGCCVGR